MAHEVSLAFLTLFDCGPVEAIRVAAETGFDMVGLRLLPAAPGEADYPLLTDAQVRRETLAALRDTGVAVGDVEIVRLKPETKAAEFERFVAVAAEVGARHVLVAGDDADRARLAASFGAFARLAAGHGLTADLEFMPWTKVPDLSAARAVIEAAGAANGGILVDALHYDRSATTLAEIAATSPRLLNYVQFCDGPAEYDRSDDGLIRVARGARLFPGEGGIDCVGLARAIPAEVTISVEVPNHALARTLSPRGRAERAMTALRRVLAAAAETPVG